MSEDDAFENRLKDERVITSEQPEYKEWRHKRSTFETKLNRVSIYRWGYSPRDRNITALLSSTFLHGGFMHVLGNMVFLYLVGAILEIAIGPFCFLALYLSAGVCASALFGIVYPSSPGPLIGASGAIAGLMGAYTLIFGLRKIKVFYSLGFYFDYAKVPALTLFPVWLANEFFQLYTNLKIGYSVHFKIH